MWVDARAIGRHNARPLEASRSPQNPIAFLPLGGLFFRYLCDFERSVLPMGFLGDHDLRPLNVALPQASSRSEKMERKGWSGHATENEHNWQRTLHR